MSTKFKIFAGTSSKKLATKISDILKVPLSPIELKKFADGEIYVKLEESTRGDITFVINSTSEPVNESIMELLVIVDALKRASANKIVVVMPYYGYARQDRTATPREPITAKLMANLLVKAGATRVVCMDLHAKQVQGFYDIPADHMEALTIFADYFEQKKFDKENLVIVSPNAGSVTRSRTLAEWIGGTLAIIDKRDQGYDDIKELGLIGDVRNKTVILLDDMITTGKTMVRASKTVLDHGAREVYACATHGIFSKNAVQLLNDANFKEIIISDTIENEKNSQIKNLTVISTDKLFAETIKRIANYKSISDLFRKS